MHNKRFKTEYVDVLDEKGNIIGKALREDAHHDNTLIHAVVDIWLFNEKGEVLVQKQSPKKHPPLGRYDKSCGGHVLSGETIAMTCEKETFEELGLKNLKFNFVEKYIDKASNKTHLIYLYYAFIDSNAKFILEEDEVEAVKWMKIEDFFKLIKETDLPFSTNAEFQVKKVLKVFTETNMVLRDKDLIYQIKNSLSL